MKNVIIDLSQDTRINRIIIALYRFGGTAKLQSLYPEIDTTDWVNNHNPHAKIRQYLQKNPQYFEPVTILHPVTHTSIHGVWGLTDAARKACTLYFQTNKDLMIQSLAQELEEVRQEVIDLKKKPSTTVLQISASAIDVTTQVTHVVSKASESAEAKSPTSVIPDFSQLSLPILHEALFMLQDEQCMLQGELMPLITNGCDWFYVGRILYETGYFKAQFYTATSALIAGAVRHVADGHDVHLRHVVDRSTLSREGSAFGQPFASFFSQDPQMQWQAKGQFSAYQLQHAVAIARRFVQLIEQLTQANERLMHD